MSARYMDTVASLDTLLASGRTYSAVRAQLDAGRWRRFGRAVLLHNAEPTQLERHQVVLLNAGPRAVWTAFTAAEMAGLGGWARETTHVLVPGGTSPPRLRGFPVRVHYTSKWNPSDYLGARPAHRTAPALVLAASTFARPRPACGILAAGVQQRIVRPQQLAEAVRLRPRLRHRRILRFAIEDIAQGAHALSEIDFIRLCRRFRLPEPGRQVIRRGPGGRRRYLDAEWIRHDGRRVVAEVDGALHLVPMRWWEDQLRQNDLVITDSLVLRFPSIVLRTEPALVMGQLGRALLL